MLRSYALGVCCILAVALIWSASSVLVQAIFVSANFSRPFFLTWVANSLFAVTLPLRAVTLFVARVARRWRNRRWSDRDPDAAIAALSEDYPLPPRSTRFGAAAFDGRHDRASLLLPSGLPPISPTI